MAYQKISEYLKTKTIFDSSLSNTYTYLPAGILTALTSMIKTKYGMLHLFSDDETDVKTAVSSMFALNDLRYTALFNVDKVDDPTKEFYEKETNTGTVTDTNTGTVTNTDSGTVTNTDTGTVTTEVTPEVVTTTSEKKNTSNNATLKTIGQIENSSTGSDTNERTDNLTHERTDDLTHERTDNLTHERTDDLVKEREGYNNKFANAEYIIRFSDYALYDIIIKDVLNTITLNVYDLDDFMR